MLATGDRVRVRGREGVVVGAQLQDSVYVRLDGGAAGNFDVKDVELVTETKSWPPNGIETK